jgi:thiamine-phosphate diphosphorylase/hydroxyethylthiazole kinase
MLGSLVACFCASARLHHMATSSQSTPGRLVQGDMFIAAIGGVLAMTIASEKAAAREDCKGPNTFRAALIDELYHLKGEDVEERVRLEVVS